MKKKSLLSLPRKPIKKRVFGDNRVSVQQNINRTYSQNVIKKLVLKLCPNRNIMELIYQNDALCNTSSPEFGVLSDHAYRDHDPNLDIQAKLDDIFSFEYESVNEGRGAIYIHSDHSRELGY